MRYRTAALCFCQIRMRRNLGQKDQGELGNCLRECMRKTKAFWKINSPQQSKDAADVGCRTWRFRKPCAMWSGRALHYERAHDRPQNGFTIGAWGMLPLVRKTSRRQFSLTAAIWGRKSEANWGRACGNVCGKRKHFGKSLSPQQSKDAANVGCRTRGFRKPCAMWSGE